ncbi:MAG: segregation/condensation protein A [Rhodospirillales bacterium]|nr:segregation/condensation protein A [Rhodospirillales bacterium]
MTGAADAPGDREAAPAGPQFVVDIDGYEGPVDVLLTLARAQKVDLRQVSILQLADQYLAFVAAVRSASLELAAEYLVMAAWLAYLKSRLLLPEPPGDEEPTGEEMAAALAFQLQRLEAVRDAGARLMARPRLGRDVFARGQPEPVAATTTTVVVVTLYDLLKAYGEHVRRRQPQVLAVEPSEVYSVKDALAWLTRALGRSPGWENLWNFLPPQTAEELRGGRLRLTGRSALAATFAASLELARQGRVRLRQAGAFGPIYINGAPDGDGAADGPPTGDGTVVRP